MNVATRYRWLPGLLALLLVSLMGGPRLLPLCHADDWPQWRGPERTAISKETGLLKEWPKDGPKLLWKITDAGEAYSGPAIHQGLLLTMGNRNDKEFVICYELATRKQKWAVENGKAYKNGEGNGPRSTPTVDGDRLYALGANGDLCCLKIADGKEVWRVNILDEYKGKNIAWGISESPLIEDKMVIVTPGGESATIVALDKMTGKPIWKSKDPNKRDAEPAGYSSAIAYTVGKDRQIAAFTSKGAIGVRVSDGKFLWRYDQVANGVANIATPIFHDGSIFFSSDYGQGCVRLDLKDDGTAKEAYFNKDLKNHHGGVVLVNGHLYGFNSSRLTCMKWEDGKPVWTNDSVGKGSLCYADGMLYVLSEGGTMGLVEATPKEYRETSRFKLPDRSKNPSWTHPVIADGKLYLRDQENVFCYEIKAK